MKPLHINWPLAMSLGVVLSVQGINSGPCYAQGLFWSCCSWSTPTGTPTSVGAVTLPSGSVVTPPSGTVVPPAPPPSNAPAAAPGVAAAPGYSAAPGYYAPAGYYAPSYYAPSSAYYYYPSSSTPSAAPAAAAIAPVSYLASFVPDAQAAPGLGGLIDPSSNQGRGQTILNGLRSAFGANRGMLFGTLLQTGLNLFAQQFLSSPNNQDYSILTDLVQKVINEATGNTGGGNVPVTPPAISPPTATQPAVTAGQGSVLIVKVEVPGADGKLKTVSQVSVSLAGTAASSHAPDVPPPPATGTVPSNTGVAPPAPPPAGAPAARVNPS
jgi:hypothetical protein